MTGTRPSAKLTCLFHTRDCVLPEVDCPPSYKAILLLLASYANPNGTQIFQSSRSLAAVLGYDRNTVRSAIKFWCDLGVLVIVKRGHGRGHAHEYLIRLVPVESLHGEKGEPFTPLGLEKGELDAPKRVNAAREKGEQKGEPFTPTELTDKTLPIRAAAEAGSTGENGSSSLPEFSSKVNAVLRTLGLSRTDAQVASSEEKIFESWQFLDFYKIPGAHHDLRVIWSAFFHSNPVPKDFEFWDNAFEAFIAACCKTDLKIPHFWYKAIAQVKRAENEAALSRVHRPPL